jgi:hypothetical protein
MLSFRTVMPASRIHSPTCSWVQRIASEAKGRVIAPGSSVQEAR